MHTDAAFKILNPKAVPKFFRLNSHNAILEFLLEVEFVYIYIYITFSPQHVYLFILRLSNPPSLVVGDSPPGRSLSAVLNIPLSFRGGSRRSPGNAGDQGALHRLEEGRGPPPEVQLRAVHPAADSDLRGEPRGVSHQGNRSWTPTPHPPTAAVAHDHLAFFHLSFLSFNF